MMGRRYKTTTAPTSSVRLVRAAGFATLFILWLGTYHIASAARFIDYLYVEANEGDSSGGHAAIRFENLTFHFQHENPGILHVRCFDSTAFEHAYALLGNRTIRESRIAVSDETYNLLYDDFSHLLLIQDAQLGILAALRRDVALFELLLRRNRDKNGTTDEVSLALKGLGYFLPDGSTVESTQGVAKSVNNATRSSALMFLSNSIRIAYGEHFVEERIARTGDVLREMKLHSTEFPLPAISRKTFPAFDLSVSTHYEDALLALYALEVLKAALPLQKGTWWTSGGDEFKLDQLETVALRAFSEQLKSDLVRLANSSRTDWGLPFIVGMARLASIEMSLTSGRLVFLDMFPVEGRQAQHDTLPERPCLQLMKEEMREVFLRRRGEFFTKGTFREAAYSALERAGNLFLETDRALATNSPTRGNPEFTFPSRAALRTDLTHVRMDEEFLERELKAAQDSARNYAAALSRLYSYNLVRRNCVTEIFTVINQTIERLAAMRERSGDSATVNPDELLKEESVRRLGGFIDASQGFSFIPFVSAEEVEANYGVVARHVRLSYRSGRLAEMVESESPLVVFLRESNIITSTIYRYNPADSPFLFFTNDLVPFRPLFGAFNLLTGFGGSLYGVVTMPFEGPGRLLSGIRGMFFSLPELVFMNIRKGSMTYINSRERYYFKANLLTPHNLN